MAESYSTLPEVQFFNALKSASMLDANQAPGGTKLFDPAIFDVRMGDDAAIFGSGVTVSVPLPKIIIAVGQGYGVEHGYADESLSVDASIMVPFTVWGNNAADLEDTEVRLNFSRDKRAHVFSGLGLLKQFGRVRGKRRPYQPIPGVLACDYAWAFFYERT